MSPARRKLPVPDREKDRFIAAVDLLDRTGADAIQFRWCEEEWPVIWMAAGCWKGVWQAAGAMNPLEAVFRLLDEVIDGGKCTHCGRPSRIRAERRRCDAP